MNASEPTTQPPSLRVLYALAAAFALLATAAFWVDVPLARLFQSDSPLPGDIEKFVELCEVFGYGLGVASLLLAMWTLDPAKRRLLPRVAICAFGAGVTVNLLKINIVRIRPANFDFSSGASATFAGFFPWWSGASDWLDTAQMSFPSGHTATAVGLAIGLSWAYPRGKWLFTFFALMVAVQRISASAHFLSDTLFGASVGLFHCGVCFHRRVEAWLFSRWETIEPPEETGASSRELPNEGRRAA